MVILNFAIRRLVSYTRMKSGKFKFSRNKHFLQLCNKGKGIQFINEGRETEEIRFGTIGTRGELTR